MHRFEDSLPKLPVPSLEETAARYLKSLRPLLSQQELASTTRAVTDFVAPGGVGETLQKRLVARRDGTKSWLYDWWTDAAYLSYRDPIIPYVSYFYSYRDDRKRRDPAKRAAAISTAALEFQKLVVGRMLEPETMKGRPMAMDSYQWMFNASRRPARPADFPVEFEPSEHQYIIAMRKNNFFKIPYELNGKQLNTAELQLQFERVYAATAERKLPVGIMTTENRDVWADAYDVLLKAHPTNAKILQEIEAASFIVCLDDAAPVTLDERAKQYLYADGQNRWFDKPCQFIINDNGTAGFNGEHSMMDGTSTHRLNDFVCNVIANNQLDFSNTSVRPDLPQPISIDFHITPEVKSSVNRAQTSFNALMSIHELRVQAYQGYGKGMIKKLKCSPDAYVQLIIQLAYFKMFGTSKPTYESVMTRRFQQGRTEVCRSVSEDSVAFCRAFTAADSGTSTEGSIKTPGELTALFRKAAASHVAYVNTAADGKGCDRHLFGLKKLLKPGEEVPAIFNDPAYTYSSTWFLSTSQLSSEYLNGFGWSQVVDQGFGIAYMINENRCVLTAYVDCQSLTCHLCLWSSVQPQFCLPSDICEPLRTSPLLTSTCFACTASASTSCPNLWVARN